ncbi:MAG TPA: cytochrome c biogenesis CcdA family protein [Paracoccaceae bacterium]|nr:cytochrome c biogenesis CcdA family protein [Paracoccaceae bacterium]
MEFLFAYGAGLLTLVNPCVLPVLPIVLASATRGHRLGPVALAGGMSLTFVVLGMGVAVFGTSLGIDEQMVSQIGAVAMVAFGAVLLVPQLNRGFELATAGLASGADMRMDGIAGNDLRGQFLGGALLGAVWSPCVGPTLGGAIALAYQGTQLGFAAGVMFSFALGISSVMLLLAYGTQSAIRGRQSKLRVLAAKSKPIMGWALLLVGLMILTKTHYRIEAWLLDVLPLWLQDLTVSI